MNTLTDDLLKKRTLYLKGTVNDEQANRVGEGILWLNAHDASEPITVYFNTSGGGVEAGLDLYDIIRHSAAPVRGIVYRMANSIASVVLQACPERIAMKHAEFKLHTLTSPVKFGDWEDNPELEFEKAKKMQQIVYDIFVERMKAPLVTVVEWHKQEKIFTADEAQKFGLVDKVM